jgi:4-alpha-glucanotransferase
VEKGWLAGDLNHKKTLSQADKRFGLRLAWQGFRDKAEPRDRRELTDFIREQGFWLEDYVLFRALQEENRACWWEWSQPLRDRQPQALEEARLRLGERLDYLRFEQFLFFRQWNELKIYANERGIKLFGDMPIFVAHDSAEVWANRELFDLDRKGMPRKVAGVPPDYFSETGQRWGNPVYNWERMKEDRFAFWMARMHTQLAMFDLIRVDHFRGFEAYWEIPAEDDHAINGRWVEAPGDALFDRLHEEFDPLPLVAEDLGIITPEVEVLRQRYDLPGMKILQFAFGDGADNPYLPFHHPRNTVVYTGTHDNDTSLGWYRSLDDGARAHVDEYLGRPKEAMPWPLIRCALASRAWLAILPMQDVMALGSEHRMNHPGTVAGNWSWRFTWDQVDEDLAERLDRRIVMYGRKVPVP